MCLRIVKFSPLSLLLRASLVVQLVKNLPAMQETWVQSLGWEDPQKKGMATHSSIVAWRISMDRGAWQTTVHRVAKSETRLSDSICTQVNVYSKKTPEHFRKFKNI